MPEAEIEAALAILEPKQNAPARLEIEPENRDAVRLFMRMQTQWQKETVVAGRLLFTRYLRLDYSAVPSLASGRGIALTESVWDGLQFMEAEALAIHERRTAEALQRL